MSDLNFSPPGVENGFIVDHVAYVSPALGTMSDDALIDYWQASVDVDDERTAAFLNKEMERRGL